MSRLSIRSTCKTAVAASLVLALLARVPFADGLLLHDHSDHGIHSHTVTLDDLHDHNLHEAWHHHHDEEPDDGNSDSDGGEYTDPLFILVNDPVPAADMHRSSGAAIASIQRLSSKILPRSMLPDDPTDIHRLWASARLSPHPPRPAFALDALLQSSRALLL